MADVGARAPDAPESSSSNRSRSTVLPELPKLPRPVPPLSARSRAPATEPLCLAMSARTWPALKACSKPSREAQGEGGAGKAAKEEAAVVRQPELTVSARPRRAQPTGGPA
eukprot:15477242-Alexandrium_andersonii.AAC.1